MIPPLNVTIATFFTGFPVKFIKIDKLIENKIISTCSNSISTRRNTEKRKGNKVCDIIVNNCNFGKRRYP